MLYLFVKLLYVLNVVGQFLLMNAFLGESGMWGFNVLNDLANGRSWKDTGHFPRVTMCDFRVSEGESYFSILETHKIHRLEHTKCCIPTDPRARQHA
jgi:hypothetical protein